MKFYKTENIRLNKLVPAITINPFVITSQTYILNCDMLKP